MTENTVPNPNTMEQITSKVKKDLLWIIVSTAIAVVISIGVGQLL